MKKESNNIGFMLRDGRGWPCLISLEDSERIAGDEGLPKKAPRPMPTEKRKAVEEKVVSSIPEEDRNRLREILRKTHEELDQPDASSDQTNLFKKGTKISDVHSFEIVNGKLIGYHGVNEKIALVPHGVSDIGEYAFGQENSASIEIIILPETIVSIEKLAFAGCDNLKYINLPKSLRKIGSRPFEGLRRLKYLYIPDEVEECDFLGGRMDLETLRLPLHLFNDTDCINRTVKLRILIIGLPEEEGTTPSQDTIDLHKIESMSSAPAIIFEQYVSSHIGSDYHFPNQVFTVDGCILVYDPNGRDYIPYDEITLDSSEFIYVVSIPKYSCVIPSDANVLDSKCGWHHSAKVLYIPTTIEFIAPDAFRDTMTFVTPASNEQNLKNILSNAEFSYQIITI